MNMPIDPVTAKGLLDAGQMTPETYARFYGDGSEQNAMQVDPNKQAAEQISADYEAKRRAAIDAFTTKGLEQPQANPTQLVADQNLAQGGLVADNQQNLGGGMGSQGMGANQMNLLPTPGLDLQQQAYAQQAAVGNAKGLDTAAQYDTMQKELALMERANEKKMIADQIEIDKEAEKYAAEIDRVSALKVDPDKFWGDRSTGQKIIAGVSLFLGALGSANNGVNRAVQVLDNAIERDIKTQLANINQENVGIAQKKGVLADMQKAFKDDRMAYLATKNAYLQRAQMEIQKIQSQYQGPEMAAKAELLIGQIEEKKVAIQREVMANIQANMQPANNKIAPQDPKLLERWVPDYGYVNQANQVKPAIELISNAKDLKGSLNELIRIGNMSAWDRMTNKVQITKDANMAQGMLVGALNKKITGGGPLSESEMALVKSIVPDTSAIMRLTASDVKMLEKLVNKIDTTTWDKLRLYGIQNPLDKYDTKDVE